MDVESLAELDSETLRELQVRATALLTSRNSDVDEVLVQECMVAAFKQLGYASLPPLAVVKQSAHYKQFRVGVKHLIEFVSSAAGAKTQLEKRKALIVFLKVIIRHLRKCQAPVTHKTVTYQFTKISGLVDVAFPGYMQSGLLPIVLRAKSA